MRKYRHKVSRRLPLSHNHGNTVSATKIDGVRSCRPSEASEQHYQQMTYCSTRVLTQPLFIEFQDSRSACDVIVSYLLCVNFKPRLPRGGGGGGGGVGQDHVRRHYAELALRNPYNSSFIGFVLCLSSEEEYLGFDDFCYYSNN